MPAQQEEITNPGQGLSNYSTWYNPKVNSVLWFFLLFLNALYTLIGVRVRDLRPNGACELNVNRTIGIVEHSNREELFWGLWSIYPIISFVIVVVQIVLQCCRDNKRTQKQQQIGNNQGNLESQLDQGNQRNESDPTSREHQRNKSNPINTERRDTNVTEQTEETQVTLQIEEPEETQVTLQIEEPEETRVTLEIEEPEETRVTQQMKEPEETRVTQQIKEPEETRVTQQIKETRETKATQGTKEMDVAQQNRGDQIDESNPTNQGEGRDKSDPTIRGDRKDESDPTNRGDQIDESDSTNQGDLRDENDQREERDQGVPVDQVEQRDQGVQVDQVEQRDQGVQVDQVDQGEQRNKGIQIVVNFLHVALVNIFVIISGSLYIAADNFFFLVDPDDQSQNPSTTRSFIAGSSLICSVLVFVVDYWFEHIVDKCLETCNYVKEKNKPTNNESALDVVRILYFWWPLAVVITTFDSLFISVVDEVSGGEDVRSGFDCTNERGLNGAKVFFIVICIVFIITIVIFVLYKIVINCTYLPKCSSCNSDGGYCFAYVWYIVHFPIMLIFFLITGLMFIAADNNWPWICFAKNDGDICYWVMVRVGLLIAVTVLSGLLFVCSGILSLIKSCLIINCCQSGTTIDQTNAAASGTGIETPNTDREEHTRDAVDQTNGAASGTRDAVDRTNGAASVIEMTLNRDRTEHKMDGVELPNGENLKNKSSTSTESETNC